MNLFGEFGGKWSATWSMRQFSRKHYIPLNLKAWAYKDVKDVRARLISSSVSPSRVQSIRHFGWHPGFCFCQTSKIGKEPGQVGVCGRVLHPLVWSIRSNFFAAALDIWFLFIPRASDVHISEVPHCQREGQADILVRREYRAGVTSLLRIRYWPDSSPLLIISEGLTSRREKMPWIILTALTAVKAMNLLDALIAY